MIKHLLVQPSTDSGVSCVIKYVQTSTTKYKMGKMESWVDWLMSKSTNISKYDQLNASRAKVQDKHKKVTASISKDIQMERRSCPSIFKYYQVRAI